MAKVKLSAPMRLALVALTERVVQGWRDERSYAALQKRGLAEWKRGAPPLRGWGTWSLTDAGKEYMKDSPHG